MARSWPTTWCRSVADDPAFEQRKAHAELLAKHLDLLAAVERAKRLLRENPQDPRKALAELGIGNPEPKTENKLPTKWGRSRGELVRLHMLYLNMTTAPATAGPVVYSRTPERLDLLLGHAALVIAGKSDPEIPQDALFETTCALPMTRGDALLNVALYAGVSPKQAWNLLKDSGLRPKVDLPPRPPK